MTEPRRPDGNDGPPPATPVPDSDRPVSHGFSAAKVPAILVAVGTLVAIVSAVTVWVRSQALDTNEWVGRSTELLEEPEIRSSLAEYLVDQLYVRVDVATALEERVPESMSGLVRPVTAALRGPLVDSVEGLLRSDRFERLWAEANRRTHALLVTVLRDETGPAVSTAGGDVVLDLRPLLVTVGGDLGISDERLDQIPDDAARVTILESEEIRAAQETVEVLDFLSWFLLLVVAALYALAVYLAVGRRLRTLRNVGLGLAGAGVFVLIVRLIAVRGLVDVVVEDQTNRPVARLTSLVLSELLREIAWSGIVLGAALTIVATLLGDRSWAVTVRRWLAPALRPAAGAAATIVTVVVLLAWWSPGRLFERWLPTLLMLALVAAAVLALRARAVEENPDVTFGDVVFSARR